MDIKDLSARDFVINQWGADVVAVIERQHTTPMNCDQFLDHCIACGGDWGAMLLTGIKKLYPEVYDVIPNKMGKYAWRTICDTLELLQIKGE